MEDSNEDIGETGEGVDVDEISSPSWFIDDDVPGVGSRPEWLPEKFEKVSDLANSYSNLEKRLGDAPSEYDYSKADDWLDPEYEGLSELSEFAKSKRVPQDVVDKMLDTVGGWLGQFKVDRSKEVESLGDNAKDRLDTLNNWAKSNLSESAYNSLVGSMVTADSIKALEEIRGLMLNDKSSVPNGNESGQNEVESIQVIEDEMKANWDKYKVDANYRKEVESRLNKAVAAGGGSYQEKHGGS